MSDSFCTKRENISQLWNAAMQQASDEVRIEEAGNLRKAPGLAKFHRMFLQNSPMFSRFLSIVLFIFLALEFFPLGVSLADQSVELVGMIILDSLQ